LLSKFVKVVDKNNFMAFTAIYTVGDWCDHR